MNNDTVNLYRCRISLQNVEITNVSLRSKHVISKNQFNNVFPIGPDSPMKNRFTCIVEVITPPVVLCAR